MSPDRTSDPCLQEERNELMRRACLSAIDRAQKAPADVVDWAYISWAVDFVTTTRPLDRPLGTGEPK